MWDRNEVSDINSIFEDGACKVKGLCSAHAIASLFNRSFTLRGENLLAGNRALKGSTNPLDRIGRVQLPGRWFGC